MVLNGLGLIERHLYLLPDFFDDIAPSRLVGEASRILPNRSSFRCRFVLATNDLELSPDTLLEYYKGQGVVEWGFRFLKDKSFRVSEVYLKKKSRIQALAIIRVFSLFIYSMVELRLRRALDRAGEIVVSPIKKQTQRPTLKWVFFLFRRVREFSVIAEGKRMSKISNLKGNMRKILGLVGPSVVYTK